MRVLVVMMLCTVTSFRTFRGRLISRKWFSANVDSISFRKDSTVQDAFDVAKNWLISKDVYDSEESAQHLLAEAAKLGYRRSDFTSSLGKVLSADELERYANFCQQRSSGVPIQYVIGNWDFFGLTLKCKPPILIPRWETEELVQNILHLRVLKDIANPRVLDIGAGTGAIGIALAHELPGSTCIAIDINPDAVQLANENAGKIFGETINERYKCIHTSFLDYVDSGVGKSMFDIVVSNPPYVCTNEIPLLQREVRDHEDPVALDGGRDGLNIVKDIISHFPKLVRDSGSKELWLEVSREHPAMIKSWLELQHNQSALMDVEWVSGIHDSCGPRFVRLRCKK